MPKQTTWAWDNVEQTQPKIRVSTEPKQLMSTYFLQKKSTYTSLYFYLSTVFFSKGTENFLAQPVKIIYLDSIKIRVQVRGFSEFCLLRCTISNLSDIFTKILDGPRHHELTRCILWRSPPKAWFQNGIKFCDGSQVRIDSEFSRENYQPLIQIRLPMK